MKRLLIYPLALLISLSAWCNQQPITNNQQPETNNHPYLDSLLMFKAKLDQQRIYATRVDYSTQETDKDGRYYRLFTPLTFYHSSAKTALQHDGLTPLVGNAAETPSPYTNDDAIINDAIDRALMNIYMNRSDLVTISESQLNAAGGLKEVAVDEEKVEVVSATETPAMPTINEDVPFEVEIKKPNFWTFKQDYYLQFLQNFFTDNWYKGGEKSYSMLGSMVFEANYNNKQKVTFENKLELKLGFQTSESDSLHQFRTTDDLVRYTGKFGLQATKHWYYTAKLLTYTQFTKGVKSNDSNIYSDFMSPFNLNLSLGMTLKFESKNKKASGSLDIGALTYNFRYVDRLWLATRYSLKEGHHTLNDFGSSATCNFTWKPSSTFSYQTRLWAYTTYRRVEAEWENTFTLQLSKLISAKLFVYPRFDDGSTRDDKYGYFQFREYTSLGFSYSI